MTPLYGLNIQCLLTPLLPIECHFPETIRAEIITMETKKTMKHSRSIMIASWRHSEMAASELSWRTIPSLSLCPSASGEDCSRRKRMVGVSSMTSSWVTNSTRPSNPITFKWENERFLCRLYRELFLHHALTVYSTYRSHECRHWTSGQTPVPYADYDSWRTQTDSGHDHAHCIVVACRNVKEPLKLIFHNLGLNFVLHYVCLEPTKKWHVGMSTRHEVLQHHKQQYHG